MADRYTDDKRLENLKAAEGKTIGRVYGYDGEGVWIVFKDGTWLNGEAVHRYDTTSIDYRAKLEMGDAREMGLISDEAYAARKAEADAAEAANTEAYERAMYEKYKAKFEPPSPS